MNSHEEIFKSKVKEYKKDKTAKQLLRSYVLSFFVFILRLLILYFCYIRTKILIDNKAEFAIYDIALLYVTFCVILTTTKSILK